MTTTTLTNGTTLVNGPVPPGDTRATIAAGNIDLELDNSSVYLQGTLVNAGTLSIDSTGDTTNLILTGTSNTLTGGGTILLSDNANNRIYGSAGSTDTLVNVNNTIAGAGQIGVNNGNVPIAFTNEAAGVIDANAVTNALFIQTGGPALVNDGLMEATNSGGLIIYNSTIDQTGGGKMLASGSGRVYFEGGADILGGTLRGTLGGEFLVTDGSASFGGVSTSSAITIAAATTVQVVDNNALYLAGTIDNLGTLEGDSTGDTTNIVLNSATVSLIGGGVLLLSDNANNRIYGNGGTLGTLLNVNNTIEGAGQIGVNSGNSAITLTNEKAGIIDANQSVALVIQTGGPAVLNEGLMEAKGTGGLVIYDTTIDNVGGTLLASGAGHDVYLEGSDIVGGQLQGTGGGLLIATAGATLDGSQGAAITIATGTTVQLADNNALYLAGTVDNLGTLEGDSTGDTTDIILNSPIVSLTGGGVLLLSDNANNRIYGSSGTDENLINVNNKIEGAGQIGVNNGNVPLALTNDSAGIIDANQTLALVIQTGGPALLNNGLLEATGTGGLEIYNSTIDNAGGTILASGAGNNVDLVSSDIVGGRLLGTGGGLIVATGGVTLDGSEGGAVTIGTLTTVELADNNNLYLAGTINNLGVLDENAGGDTTNIVIDSATVSLTGGGTLLLSDSGNNRIYGNSGSQEILINVNNTIEGAGQIGVNNGNVPLALTNDAAGVINADDSVALEIQTSGPALINKGLLEATGTGGLIISNTTINQTGGGKILASGAGIVYLENGADIIGGTLRGTLGGEIVVAGGAVFGGPSIKSALTIAASTTVQIDDNTNLSLYGTINNLGTLFENSTGDTTTIILQSPTVSLTGKGTLLLSDNSNNQIYGSSGTNDTLINVSNTIAGAGNLGVSNGNVPLALTNAAAGVIDATDSLALVIQTGGPTVLNQGLLEATGTGGLVINGTAVTNASTGTIAAYNSSLVQFDGNADLLNEVAGTLTGGAYAAYATTASSALELAGGGALTVDAAKIILSGTGAEISFWDGNTYQAIETSLTQVSGTGTLEILNDKTYVTTDDLTISAGGVLDVAAGTLETAGIVFANGAASRLIINAASDIVGPVTAAGGTLELAADTGKIATLSTNLASQLKNFGEIQIDAGAILDFTKSATFGKATELVNAGRLETTGSAKLVIDSTFATNSTTGTIAAFGSSLVEFASSADLGNEVAGTLTGGAYMATGSSALELSGGGALGVDDAKIIISGPKSNISFWNGTTYQAIETSLTDVSSTGTLEILGDKTYVTSNELTISAGGVLDLATGTLDAAGLDFLSGTTSRLIINAGSDIASGVTAGGGTLELAADGTTIATLGASLQSQLSHFGLVTIDSGAILDFNSNASIGAMTMLVNSGTIKETSTADLTINGKLSGDGSIDIGHSPLTLDGSVAAGQHIQFSGTSETVDLGSPNSFSGTVNDFAIGDTIDLTSVALGSITSMNFTAGILTLTEATGKIDITFASPNQFGADHFALFTEGAGTGITLSSAPQALPAATPADSHAAMGAWAPDIFAASATSFLTNVTLAGRL